LVARSVELGAQMGYRFTAADVEARCQDPGLPASTETTPGWTPVKVFFRGSEAWTESIYTGSRRFTEPFFQDSIRAARRNPFTAIFRREMPLEAAGAMEGLHPTGFVFHMSRCGSTLIAQMLAALDRAIVISEAAPIDDVLQAGLPLPDLPRLDQV